jgi:acetate kinase
MYEAGIRRYGFHGLSYEYIVQALSELDLQAANGRLVVAHLGSGCSMAAIHEGKSVACTLGFTALDGLPMGTRCGQIDPGVLLYLMRVRGMDANQLEILLYKQSGLLGLSGLSSDMRDLLSCKESTAKIAVDHFIYRIGRELGSLAAALGGLDALVFTGGIGELAASIRSRVCRDAAWLQVSLDESANRRGESRISPAGRTPSVWAIRTDEELMIARHTVSLLLQGQTAGQSSCPPGKSREVKLRMVQRN